MSEGKHVLTGGNKLHRSGKENKGKGTVIQPGERFDATKGELKAFGDCIGLYTESLVEEVDEVEGSAGDADTKDDESEKTD